MTKQRIIELLEIEHECMLRGANNKCDRNCAECELVQDDKELHEMYTRVIATLKGQDAAVNKNSPITYKDCSNALLMLWIYDIITDGEYYRIMDRLNKAHLKGVI